MSKDIEVGIVGCEDCEFFIMGECIMQDEEIKPCQCGSWGGRSMKHIAILTACMVLISSIIPIKGNLPFEQWSIERRASEAHIEDVNEFILLSSITEAESNRSQTDNEGRIMVAICILNRVNDDTGRFGEGITGVISQSGQFSTCRRASDGSYYSVTDRTDLSDQAVIEAVRRIEAGEAPAVLWFNCRYWFSWAEPYGTEPIGGNYFSL